MLNAVPNLCRNPDRLLPKITYLRGGLFFFQVYFIWYHLFCASHFGLKFTFFNLKEHIGTTVKRK